MKIPVTTEAGFNCSNMVDALIEEGPQLVVVNPSTSLLENIEPQV